VALAEDREPPLLRCTERLAVAVPSALRPVLPRNRSVLTFSDLILLPGTGFPRRALVSIRPVCPLGPCRLRLSAGSGPVAETPVAVSAPQCTGVSLAFDACDTRANLSFVLPGHGLFEAFG
jgi:hypothetical protein